MDIRMLRVLQMLAATEGAPLEPTSKPEPGPIPEPAPAPKPEPKPLLTAQELEELEQIRREQRDRMLEEYVRAKAQETAGALARSKAELAKLLATNPDHPRAKAELRRQRRAMKRKIG